jgi:hypothetical protein
MKIIIDVQCELSVNYGLYQTFPKFNNPDRFWSFHGSGGQVGLSTEARVRAWISPCGISVAHSGTGTGFSLSSWIVSLLASSTVAVHTHIFWGSNTGHLTCSNRRYCPC